MYTVLLFKLLDRLAFVTSGQQGSRWEIHYGTHLLIYMLWHQIIQLMPKLAEYTCMGLRILQLLKMCGKTSVFWGCCVAYGINIRTNSIYIRHILSLVLTELWLNVLDLSYFVKIKHYSKGLFSCNVFLYNFWQQNVSHANWIIHIIYR